MEKRKSLVLFVLMFLADLYGFSSAVEFEPCLHAVNNEPCNMTCRVQDFTNTVEIKFNGSSRGRCTLFGCDSNFLKEGGNTVIYKIPSLSYANDDGKWECTYGGNPSSPSNVTIYSGISNTPNLTFSQNDADGVKLTAIVECLYPYNPKVDVQYSETGDDEQFASLSQQVNFQSSTTPGGCSDAIERRLTATYDVSAKHAKLEGKSVFFRMGFSQYEFGQVNYTNIEGPFYFKGLTTLSSIISSDMPTTVSEVPPLSVSSSSEVPPPLVSTSSAGLSQKIVITVITISSILVAGVLIIFVTVLVVKQCRQKKRQTPAKNKENHFATEQGNFTKKDALKSSIKPRKSKFSRKRNTKQESISLDKFKHTQFNNSQAPKDRMYEHYPQTTHDYMYLNNIGNQHVFNHSHTERNMILYGNLHDSYPKSHSRANHRMVYLSPYPEHPGHNEGMFQYYRANNQGQQMYQRPYVAQYDHHIKDKPVNERSFEGRTYERNWDFLY